MNKDNVSFTSLFAFPIMSVQLDLDLEKLTELVFQLENKDKKGVLVSNRGGWQSNNIIEENYEELKKLKKEINQYLQTYQSEVFRGMVFKGNFVQTLVSMWVNINKKHHYNEWHVHPLCTLSGVFYIKHGGSVEQGNILFKHPKQGYMNMVFWPPETIEKTNEVTSEVMDVIPKSNMLVIFPSWLEHKVGMNLKDDTRISLSFNSVPILEKKS